MSSKWVVAFLSTLLILFSVTAMGQNKRTPVQATEAFMKFTIVIDKNPPIELAGSLGSDSKYSLIQNERGEQVICDGQPYHKLKEEVPVNTSTKTEITIKPLSQIDDTLKFNLILSYYTPLRYNEGVHLTKNCILKTATISGIELNTVESIVYGQKKVIPLDNGSQLTITAIRDN